MIQCSCVSGFTYTQFTMPIPLIRPWALPLYWRRTSSILCEKSLSMIVSSNAMQPSSCRDLFTHVVPYETRRHLLVTQKPVDGIVAHVFNMVGEVCQRVVDRTHQQVLAVIQAGRAVRHALDIKNLGFALGLPRFRTIPFRPPALLFSLCL